MKRPYLALRLLVGIPIALALFGLSIRTALWVIGLATDLGWWEVSAVLVLIYAALMALAGAMVLLGGKQMVDDFI